jgi:phosphoserine phosphatase
MVMSSVPAWSDLRMIVWDLDSTFIQEECIDELARIMGVDHQVASITEQAMLGNLDFDQALCERVALLRGLPRDMLNQVVASLNVSAGIELMLSRAKKFGIKTAIVSGGFSDVVAYFARKYSLDYYEANHLLWDDDLLSGRVAEPIINAEAKRLAIYAWSARENISTEQVLVAGDGANDCLMAQAAGWSIAYHAKPILQDCARWSVSQGDWSHIAWAIDDQHNQKNKRV